MHVHDCIILDELRTTSLQEVGTAALSCENSMMSNVLKEEIKYWEARVKENRHEYQDINTNS